VCKGSGGVFEAKACATEHLLGSCKLDGSGVRELYYANNALNLLAEDAKAKCERGVVKGKWQDGPAAAEQTAVVLSAPERVKSHCDRLEKEGNCTEFVTADAMGMQKQTCEARRGAWKSGACPRLALTASCAQGGGRIEHYLAAMFSGEQIDRAQKQCETEMFGQRGHWIAGALKPALPNAQPSASAIAQASHATAHPSAKAPAKPPSTPEHL
jgi:hypothetical protein